MSRLEITKQVKTRRGIGVQRSGGNLLRPGRSLLRSGRSLLQEKCQKNGCVCHLVTCRDSSVLGPTIRAVVDPWPVRCSTGMVSPYLPEALARIMAAIVIPPELAFTVTMSPF